MCKLLVPVVGSLLLVACGNTRTCPSSTTLESLVTCIRWIVIHIEQDPDFRNPSDWIVPITDTFP